MSDHQRQAISLNIEYKMSILEELKEDTGKLQGRAQSAVDDMNKVGDEIGEVTGDMREIVDGLASGLSPQQGGTPFSSVVKIPSCHLLGPQIMLLHDLVKCVPAVARLFCLVLPRFLTFANIISRPSA